MIWSTSRKVRVFAYPQAADLRKGYDGLYGLVTTAMGHDVLSGDLFLFVNRRRDGCKDAKTVKLTTSELALFIEGSNAS